MSPPRVSSAESITAPDAIAAAISAFLTEHPEAVLLEGGKAAFVLAEAKHRVNVEHGRCTLQVWDERSHFARTIASAAPRAASLRLAATRLGQTTTRTLELTAKVDRRTPTSRDRQREDFLTRLERTLTRTYHPWDTAGFRTSMDLERSFGPAYARGMMTQGKQAWAVIAVSSAESVAIVEGILTPGILWLEYLRTHSDGRRIVEGLRVIVPRGRALVTQSRMRWLNEKAARWELVEFDEEADVLLPRDLDDTGNIRTALTHHPDERVAQERFAEAIADLMSLVPDDESERVDTTLRTPTELSFQLHGLEFACARIKQVPGRFAHTVELSVGAGAEAEVVSSANREELRLRLAELFARRRAADDRRVRQTMQRAIGERGAVAHNRLAANRLRVRASNNANDPLYRASPERWLESVLRRDLAPLTRGLALATSAVARRSRPIDANDDDSFGNRIEEPMPRSSGREGSLIPRLDPRHVYAQVATTAGASDRGLLDLLGVTTDGRLAVIEIKAGEDMQFAMQGLDYWLRMREHHQAQGELQRHGYFPEVVLSTLPPRLFLVAPALRIHPATETVLRYFASEVEWQLIALDERWREAIRVVWRRSSKNI